MTGEEGAISCTETYEEEVGKLQAYLDLGGIKVNQSLEAYP